MKRKFTYGTSIESSIDTRDLINRRCTVKPNTHYKSKFGDDILTIIGVLAPDGESDYERYYALCRCDKVHEFLHDGTMTSESYMVGGPSNQNDSWFINLKDLDFLEKKKSNNLFDIDNL